ncbi:MAG: hypothetical protein ACREI3_09870, partial [Nitrospirales bacterium]
MVPVTRHVTELAPTALGLVLAVILSLSPLGTSSRAAGTDPGMVLVPAGEFLMGSPAGTEGYR